MIIERAPLIAHVIYKLDFGGLENGLVNIVNRWAAGLLRRCNRRGRAGCCGRCGRRSGYGCVASSGCGVVFSSIISVVIG